MGEITTFGIKMMLAMYGDASAQNDANGVANHYTSPAEIFVSGKRWVTGRDAIRRKLQKEFAVPGRVAPEVTAQPPLIAHDGQTAFVDESFVEADGTKGSVRNLLVIEDDRVRIHREWIIYL